MKKAGLFISAAIAMLYYASIAEARFFDPGAGDPYKNGGNDYMRYNIAKPLPPPKQDIKVVYRVNQAAMHTFSQKARALPLPPDRAIETELGQKIYQVYKDFLSPAQHSVEFKKEELKLAQVRKVPKDPNLIAAERLEKRTMLLFEILDGSNRVASTKLWHMANLKDSSADLQRRDAVFSALAAQRIGWENAALMAYEYAIDKGLGKLAKTDNPKAEKALHAENSYYTNIILKEAANFKSEYYIEMLVSRLDRKMISEMPSDPNLDRIFFTIAKKYYSTDEAALEFYAQKLSENSSELEKMQLLQALGLIENRKHKDALQLLKSLASSENSDVNEKARVNLARLLAIFSEYDQALNIYRSLSIDSLERLDSLMEVAWLEYENGEYQYSLGKSIGLQTKFYYHAFLPEIYILEAYNRKGMCDFGGAELAIKTFKQDYTREIRELRNLVRNKVENKAYSMYSQVKDAFRNQGEKRMRRYERFLLQVPVINNMQATLFSQQLEYERLTNETLQANFLKDTEYLVQRDYYNESLHAYYKKKKAEFAPIFEQTIYDELKYLDRKLLAIFQQVEYLNLDIVSSADMNQSLQSAMNYPTIPEQKEEALPEYKERWPFEDNEYWEDEIAWLKSKNPSKCVPKSKDDIDNSLASIQ